MIDKSKIKKVLIVHPHGIGDVLFSTPLIRNLQNDIPGVQVDYVGNRRTEGILKAHKRITNVFVYERDEFYAIYEKSKMAYYKAIWAFIKEMKQKRYDMVFDLSMNANVSFITFLARIKYRIGYNYKGRSRFLNIKRILTKDGFHGKHVSEYYLDLLADIGVSTEEKRSEVYTTNEAEEWAQRFLVQNNIDPQVKLVGIIPGGGSSWGQEAKYKQWPTQKFAEVIKELSRDNSVEFVLLGDSKDALLCKEIVEQVRKPVVSCAGETDLLQYIALVKQCRCVLANDGGPLHMAVAAGVPTVSIFGPVDPNVYGPFPRDKHRVHIGSVDGKPAYSKFRLDKEEALASLERIKVVDVIKSIKSFIKD